MDQLLVQGGVPLRGSVKANGSKNASLPIMAAALLSPEPVIIESVPDLMDVRSMAAVLQALGASVRFEPVKGTMNISAEALRGGEPPPQLVQQMRASFLVLGPLLARTAGRGFLPGAVPSVSAR